MDLDYSRSSSQNLDLPRPTPFVQPVANGSYDYNEILENVDSVYKTLNHPTPDLMYVSPMVGNCMMLEKLGRSRQDQGTSRKRNPQLAPKLVALPINPLIPPPYELMPDFAAWHNSMLEQGIAIDDSQWLFVQCSLSSSIRVLEKQGYELLQVEHNIALFGRKLGPAVKFAQSKPLRSEELWLQGWRCSPAAETFDSLSWKSGLSTELLVDNSVSPALKVWELCSFVDRFNLPISEKNFDCELAQKELMLGEKEIIQGQTLNSGFPLFHGLQQAGLGENPLLFFRTHELENPFNELGKKFLLESNNRGRCMDDLGICECFVPFRGRFCELRQSLKSLETDEKTGKPPAFTAALHYLIGDTTRLIEDMRKSLRLLWQNFNRFYQYPVVLFHDGLSAESRRFLIESSLNPIWFALVEDFTKIPAHLMAKIPQNDFAGYPLGYRGMCRFRSGPIFLHPLLKNFDYAWTLDSDG